MLKVELMDTYGWDAAIRGMRNPKNSWAMSDSHWQWMHNTQTKHFGDRNRQFVLGERDLTLARTLSKAGSDHGKFLRMIGITMDITAPLYWWKEFDTYKVGTVADSCSTMHKIHTKEFTRADFSMEHMTDASKEVMDKVIESLNFYRDVYNNGQMLITKSKEVVKIKPKDKDIWWQLIQLLPSSYNQKRTISLNYAVAQRMFNARHNHKLDEWHTLCDAFRELPYFGCLCCLEEE